MNDAVDDSQCVTRSLLERNARQWPQLSVLRFDNGEAFTCAELLQAVKSRAAALQQLGVQQGEYVLSWLPNCPLAVLNLLALNFIGAIYVPINTAYKASLLQHVLHNVGARLMIADGRLLTQLAGVDTGSLQTIVVTGPERPQLPGIELLPDSVLQADPATLREPVRAIQARDTQCVIFTSGTTGPSKGVLCSYRHTYRAACEFRHVGPGDCNLVALPMFHMGGVLGINFALIHGGTAAIVERFRTASFWETVARLEVSAVGLLGTMVQFLVQQPLREHEKQHSIRTAVIAPFGDEALLFAERFAVDVFTEFNMTELSVPLWCGPNPTLRGTCGKPRAGVELRLVDTGGREVAVGSVGELILRTQDPFELSHGYLNDPQATARSWREGWFHTGDLFYRDADDNYFFVDRARDMMRRRGENISSFEVEAELLQFPGVKAAAALGVPGDGGEDEVLAVLSPLAGARLDPGALIAFLQPRLANFMIPRYVRIIAELPLTPTQKIEKHVLRAQGITDDTWDREAAGIQLPRLDLSNR
ncbi:MAG: AMP-binding protein [Pseudomonadales bacterium]|nr:AMP-binding protein [Pseudomonadales bacterium]